MKPTNKKAWVLESCFTCQRRSGIKQGLPGCIFCLRQQRGQESKELLWISKYTQEGQHGQTKTFQSRTLCHGLSNYRLCEKNAKHVSTTQSCGKEQMTHMYLQTAAVMYLFPIWRIQHRPETERWVNRPVSQLFTAISEGGRQPERWYKFYLCLPCPVQLHQGI